MAGELELNLPLMKELSEQYYIYPLYASGLKKLALQSLKTNINN
jgi:hypothetical protein